LPLGHDEMTEKILEVKRVSVGYGKLKVIKDVSLYVNHGELVALVGANGAGKTTLLNTVAGLLKPSSGEIRFQNYDLHNLTPHEIVEIGISLVPEGRRIFGEMSVLENLIVGSYIRKARKVRDNTLEFVFDLFPILKERKNQTAATLSGGEQQMLALGRALMSMPKVLLLDEISIGLAPKVIGVIYDAIQRISDEGVACLIVEQHIREVFKRANRIYVLRSGQITLSGDSSQLDLGVIEKAYFGV